MPLTSLLYVSKSTIAAEHSKNVVAEIVETATANNARFGITGALLFTGQHFAQLLEGSASNIDVMMSAIMQDERHTGLVVVERDLATERRTLEWSMAYHGPSKFVERHVTALLTEPPLAIKSGGGATWLRNFLCEFARPPISAPPRDAPPS